KKAVNEVNETLKGKEFDVIILDEILIGVSQGFMDESVVLKIIRSKPMKTELVLTGRGATKKLINSADYVTYMKDMGHPFSKGVRARRGIDF
ncbi:MAG: cob(I)yrinic acid a,c-diamide adenosyltransferase, partial [Candidatus Omnitrophica bacterium]|nr:cob(I)yrinic acid a,c-diamide adenosyltransferase [Candidatus Omnitrophota bacterium]